MKWNLIQTNDVVIAKWQFSGPIYSYLGNFWTDFRTSISGQDVSMFSQKKSQKKYIYTALILTFLKWPSLFQQPLQRQHQLVFHLKRPQNLRQKYNLVECPSKSNFVSWGNMDCSSKCNYMSMVSTFKTKFVSMGMACSSKDNFLSMGMACRWAIYSRTFVSAHGLYAKLLKLTNLCTWPWKIKSNYELWLFMYDKFR